MPSNPTVIKLTKQANYLLRNNDPKKALHLLAWADDIEPDNNYILGSMTKCYLAMNDNSKALVTAKKNASIHGGPIAFGLLTQALLADGQNQEALEAAMKNITLIENATSYGLLTQALLANGLSDQAVQAANKSVALSGSPTSYGLLTQAYMADGQTQKAVEAAQEAVRLSKNPVSYTLLTQALLADGRIAEAIETAKTNIKLSGSPMAYGMLTRALLANGHTDEALVNAEKALLINNDGISLGLLSEALRKNKQYELALTTINQIKPDDLDFSNHLCRAYCYMHIGQYNNSLDSFNCAKYSLTDKERATQKFFDPGIRLYCGYIFLFDIMLNESTQLLKGLYSEVKWAAGELMKVDPNTLGSMQEKDYANAMKLVDRYQL